MRTWAKGSTSAAFLAVGVMALGSGTAYADTGGAGSVLGGNQINIPITLPIDISGNAVAVAGESEAVSRGGASVQSGAVDAGGNRTSGRGSILGGNQVVAPITAPVNLCGNAVSVLGESAAGCKGGAEVKGSQKSGKGGAVDAGGNRTSGRGSILGGNQVVAPITAPVNLCGNALAIFGDAVAGCHGGATVKPSVTVKAGGNRTSGRSSILGGNQVVVPITAPINVCGNSVAVLGGAFSGCKGGSSVGGGHGHGRHTKPGSKRRGGGGHWHRPGSTGHDTDGRYSGSTGTGTWVVKPPQKSGKGGKSIKKLPPGSWGSGGNRTSGRSSIGGGNQVVAPITLPINICGNAVAIIGDAFAGCRGGATVKGGWGRYGGVNAGGNRTSGRSSILGGNQVVAPITAPVNLCGNSVAVLGDAAAGCLGGSSVYGGVNAGGNRTSGRGSILGGNQVVAPITAPVNLCGNSVAVLGDAAAGCLGGARVAAKRGYHGYSGKARWYAASQKTGMMREVPTLPMLSELKEASGLSQRMSAAAAPSAPILGDLPNMKGLSGLPNLPAAAKGNTPVTARADSAVREVTGSPLSQTVEGLTGELPVNKLPVGDLKKTTDLLKLDGIASLSSAEQPADVTGNRTSFAVLVLGGMFAVSASLFAFTRRIRFGRR